MIRCLLILAYGVTFACANTVFAQSKVTGPQSTTRPSATSAAQVRACLFIARDISELTDKLNIAKAREDAETFNSTVNVYNAALRKWNAGCTRPYSPADMIRAENATGLKLCRFTQTPCLTEAARRKILADELKRQQADKN